MAVITSHPYIFLTVIEGTDLLGGLCLCSNEPFGCMLLYLVNLNESIIAKNVVGDCRYGAI